MLEYTFTYGTHRGIVMARNRTHAISQIRETYGFGHGDITIN